MSGSSAGSTCSLCLHSLTINPLDPQNPLPPPRTCKKAVVWTTEEEGMLLDFLASHLSQAGDGNFKKAMWNAAAAHMAHNHPLSPDNGNKTAESCERKFKALKKSYYAVTDLKLVASGFAYDDKHGAMILLDNTDLWDRYVKAHKDMKPFCNSGFPHFASVELLLPSHGQAGSSSSSAVTSISHGKRKAESVVMSKGGSKCSQPLLAKVHAEEDRSSFITAITSRLNNFTHVIAAPLPLPPTTNPLVDTAVDYINSMPQLSTDDWIDIGDYFLSATPDEVNIFLKHQELAKQIWVQHWLMKYWDGQR
ncbi:hypothetical protein M404DRAFT_17425 [Pisolithus tinctorius Marx 270]|uniref:Myb-like domain-containing protein n=1 Tax=Pisolithus tinctorius Marx 270 TaxID=870435 RepID=A0A0C3KYA3_PISTI|nr:hypothetical protein M404DRAFT_17425 [Pisolithus tinctorius Marx 270]